MVGGTSLASMVPSFFWKFLSQFSHFLNTLRVYRIFGLIESKGESAQPLQSQQIEYLAVSLDMDYFEQLDKDGRKNLNTVFIK